MPDVMRIKRGLNTFSDRPSPVVAKFRHNAIACPCCILCFVLSGCKQHEPAASAPVLRAVAEFNESFVPSDSTIFEDSDSAVIALPAATIRFRDRVAILDASEGDVKVFSSKGKLIRRFGRKGHGPGEFQTPMGLAIGAGDTTFVGDNGTGIITVFDSAGVFVRSFRPGVSLLGLHILSNGDFVIKGRRSRQDPAVAYVVSKDGTRVTPILPVRLGAKSKYGHNQFWLAFLDFRIAVVGDTVFAVSSLTDSLWQYNLRSHRTTVSRIPVPGFKVPPLPDVMTPSSAVKWIESFYNARRVFGDNSILRIVFGKGDESSGNLILMERSRDGSWTALEHAPFISGADRSGLFGPPVIRDNNVVSTHYVPR